MIIDPTSITVKNVTPHCSQIQDVLDFFKRAHVSLEALETTVVSTLEEQGVTEDHETIDGNIKETLHGILGGEKINLLARVLRVGPCSECFKDVQQN